uniref:TRAF family member-associated NFKB activator n=1 Tax=Neogobius melanostomus TaxID=47308 RepID=A0A8C6V227_9GOBI
MERNIGDQLNKAFEAYRQVSIEKEVAKKELQKMTEYYEGYTRKLQKQIEDQQRLISVLEAKLSDLRPPLEMKCEPGEHHHDGIGAYKKLSYQDNSGGVPCNLPTSSTVDCRDMQDAFEAIQAKFWNIKSLTRRQKDQLKRLSGGNDAFNDQRFSMPIQCTDRTAETERPFSSSSSALRPPVVDIPLATTSSLASRGGGGGAGGDPEDRELDSLTKFSVKFPPSADSEYDFLNSAPERRVVPGLALTTEEESVELPLPFVYPTSPAPSTSSSLSQESVRGPHQPLWSPELCDAVEVGMDLVSTQSGSPDKCAFCHAVVAPDRMNMHLYSHFSDKTDSSQ